MVVATGALSYSLLIGPGHWNRFTTAMKVVLWIFRHAWHPALETWMQSVFVKIIILIILFAISKLNLHGILKFRCISLLSEYPFMGWYRSSKKAQSFQSKPRLSVNPVSIQIYLLPPDILMSIFSSHCCCFS